MSFPIAVLTRTVDEKEKPVELDADVDSGRGFTESASGKFFIATRDLKVGQPASSAMDTGVFRCLKQNRLDAFAVDDQLTFDALGVSSGGDPLYVQEASASGDQYVIAELNPPANEVQLQPAEATIFVADKPLDSFGENDWQAIITRGNPLAGIVFEKSGGSWGYVSQSFRPVLAANFVSGDADSTAIIAELPVDGVYEYDVERSGTWQLHKSGLIEQVIEQGGSPSVTRKDGFDDLGTFSVLATIACGGGNFDNKRVALSADTTINLTFNKQTDHWLIVRSDNGTAREPTFQSAENIIGEFPSVISSTDGVPIHLIYDGFNVFVK